MDFGKAFTFMFEDPDWLRKLGIGTLILLVGFLLFWSVIGLFVALLIVLGYTLVVTRNVMDRHERPMPEWHEWANFLSLGVKLAVALLIWALPMIVASIPLMIGGSLTGNNDGAEAVGAILITCTSCLMVIWGLVVTLFTPAIYVAIAAHGQLRRCFPLRPVVGLSRAITWAA